MVAKDAIYHQQCKSDFLRKKDVPGHGQSRKTPGRSSSKPMVEFFGTFCKRLDGQTELDTIFEQNEKLGTFAENNYVYSIKWPKKKAERRDSMFFAETPGLSNTVSFKDMTGDILYDK